MAGERLKRSAAAVKHFSSATLQKTCKLTKVSMGIMNLLERLFQWKP
jgi:hypothetical protein